jgi:Putative DNA-binding domain
MLYDQREAMKSMYADRLESFSAPEMLEALEAVGDEHLRLEFKQQHIPNATLAYDACAMANAEGGIIAIGFNERDAAGNIDFGLFGPVDIGNRKKTSIANGLNSLVYPPMPIDIWGYETDAPDRGFLIVRIARSQFAPHEFLRQDQPRNLPIRRDTVTGSLTLAEIDALRARSQAVPSESPIRNKNWTHVSIADQTNATDFMFGIEIAPLVYDFRTRAMDVSDDIFLREVETATRGIDNVVHPPLDQDECEAHGLWLHSGTPPAQPGLPYQKPAKEISVDSAGEIVVRFGQDGRDVFQQYVATMLTAYVFAQEVFERYGLAPRARAHLRLTLNADRLRSQTPLPSGHEDWFEIDLTLPFSDNFAATTMVMWRRANQPTDKTAIIQVLDNYAESWLPEQIDVEERWLEGPHP